MEKSSREELVLGLTRVIREASSCLEKLCIEDASLTDNNIKVIYFALCELEGAEEESVLDLLNQINLN